MKNWGKLGSVLGTAAGRDTGGTLGKAAGRDTLEQPGERWGPLGKLGQAEESLGKLGLEGES